MRPRDPFRDANLAIETRALLAHRVSYGYLHGR